MKKYISYLLLAFLSSCQLSNCEVDKDAEQLYFSKISEFENKNFYDSLDRNNLVFIGNGFRKITGHAPQIYYGFRAIYDSLKKEEDVKLWQNWYSENKCNLKYQDLYSVFNDSSKVK